MKVDRFYRKIIKQKRWGVEFTLCSNDQASLSKDLNTELKEVEAGRPIYIRHKSFPSKGNKYEEDQQGQLYMPREE